MEPAEVQPPWSTDEVGDEDETGPTSPGNLTAPATDAAATPPMGQGNAVPGLVEVRLPWASYATGWEVLPAGLATSLPGPGGPGATADDAADRGALSLSVPWRTLATVPTEAGPALVLWGVPLVALGVAVALMRRTSPKARRGARDDEGDPGRNHGPGRHPDRARDDPRDGGGDDARGGAPVPGVPIPGVAPLPGLRGLLEMGQNALQREALEEAIGWFETAIAVNPELAVAHLCLGLSLAELGRDEQALEALEAAARLEPDDPVPCYHLARVLARAQRTGEALEFLGPILRACPELAEQVSNDPAFAALHDHPQFLADAGRL